MKISLNWIKDYLDLKITAEKLAYKLTMAGLEVEKISSVDGDTVIEIEVTPNRPDCLNILGITREIAAILDKTYKLPKIKKITIPKKKCDINIDDKQGCIRYIGMVIENVKVAEAQSKIKKRMKVLGLRSVNNIVDITNFCLMETGQPMHAFDYDKLVGGKIIVRRAKKSEKIVTIDEVERELDPSILVIADAKKPVAIAGIMGGKETEVTSATKKVLLESAYFEPVLTRRASRKLGLTSDSSYRFERGVDYETVKKGSDRAVSLILESAGGSLTKYSDTVVSKPKVSLKTIKITVDKINNYLGASLTKAKCVNILKKLECKVSAAKSGQLNVIPPRFRPDLKQGVDIIEEVSRVIGYDSIPLSMPQIRITNVKQEEKRNKRSIIKNILCEQGFNEIITFSTINKKQLEQTKQEDLEGIEIQNPLSQDQEIMRPSLLPSLLNVAQYNINRGQQDIKYYEIGKIYTKKHEKELLGIIATGSVDEDWRKRKRKIDYFEIKGALEEILKSFGIKETKIKYVQNNKKFLSKGHRANILLGDVKIGYIGKIADEVVSSWDIKHKEIFFGKIEVEELYKIANMQKKFTSIPEFPFIARDISLAVKRATTFQDIKEIIINTPQKEQGVYLSGVTLVEEYLGDKIEQGKKGLTFSLTYQSKSKTLRDEEVSTIHQEICTNLVKELEASIR